jgi:hypothetical protein
MKRKAILSVIFGFSILALVFLSACNKFEPPPTMWNPNTSYPTGSVITSMVPQNSEIVLAGVREISIIGKFSNDLASNWIYFGTEQGNIKRMSATADTLIVYRPVSSGPLTLKAVITQADSMSAISYNLEAPVRSFDIAGLRGTVSVMEANKNGTTEGDTVWMASNITSTGSFITMVLPDGTVKPYKDTSYLKPKAPVTNKATDFFKAISDMKFGPQGFLYATFVGSKSLYQLNPASAMPVVYATVPAAYTSSVFDFNSNGDIYFNGLRGGLLLIKKGATTSVAVGAADYAGTTFAGIRVYNGYVYGAAASSTILFRSPINSDGTVGSKETVINIAADTSLHLNNCTISSFNFGADGTIFLSLLNNTIYSLYVLKNGSLSPYYYNNILPTEINQLTWGGGRYLYLRVSAATTLYRMGMAKEDNTPLLGAPYLGRGL